MNREPLLHVHDLSISFHQGETVSHVVKNVSFDIHKGETLALVGESGSGKSVTAYAIMRLLPYPMAFHPSGEIWFEQQDLLQLPEQTMLQLRGNRIGMIFQEPMTALNPLHTVEKQIAEILILHKGLDKTAIRKRTLELLELVQLPNPEQRLGAYPHELSGGQRQRVMIAMALANEPDILIADEPTTALDVTVQREILNLLMTLQAKLDMALLLITHDLGVVKHFADRVAVLYDGCLVEQAPTTTLFNSPQQAYTRELLQSEPSGHPISVKTDTGHTRLRTEALSVSFPLNKPLFRKPDKFLHAVKAASISVPAGTTLGIVGESGSGKSTLALAILRLISSQGSIRLDEHELQGLGEKEIRPLRKSMQIVFQDPFSSLSPRMTVSEIIAEGLSLHSPMPEAGIDAKVVEVMREVDLDPDTRHRYPHEFSGGQRQRIAIARALILDPELVFLDEPTSALDRAVQVQVVNLLRRLQRERGITYIFISHDLKVVKALSHTIAVMRKGEIVEYGPAENVFQRPTQAYTRELLEATLN